MHKAPMVNNKPFRAIDHMQALEQAGLVTKPKELEHAGQPDFKPGGSAKKEGGRLVYPHFGRPSGA